ncbi:MAG: hypothetical protein HC915_20220 [Anaerolineae bacterium]|nr:hypothetical protein [Anaerolineae bacterium]
MDNMGYMDRVEAVAATAAKAVREKTHDKRIIILYPRHRQHTALIALLYKHYEDRMYYYALSEDDNDLRSFLTGFSHDAMFPINFGLSIRNALQSSESPREWARAMAQDLTALRDEQFMVLLDNLDLLPKHDDVDAFFLELPRHLPEKFRSSSMGASCAATPGMILLWLGWLLRWATMNP